MSRLNPEKNTSSHVPPEEKLHGPVILLLLLMLLVSSFDGEARAESSNKFAIIVGINQYDDLEIPPLHCAENDATAFSRYLVTRMGFDEGNVFLLTSSKRGNGAARKGNIAVALGSIVNAIKPGGTFIFFFSGHGITDDGESFLLTQDAFARNRISLEETALNVAKVRDYITMMKADRVLLVVDACRTDPGGKKGDDRNVMSGSFAKSLIIRAGKKTAGGRVIRASATLFSCSEGESSYEWIEKERGFFSYYLLRGLEGEAADEKGQVTLNSLESYLSHKVNNTVKVQRTKSQTPWLERSGSNAGAWVLATPSETGASATSQPSTPDSSSRDSHGASSGGSAPGGEANKTDSSLAYYRSGCDYSARGDSDRALVEFTRAISLNPEVESYYLSRAQEYMKKGVNDCAIEDFSRVLQMNPSSFNAYANRGIIYYMKADYDRAIADYTRALSLDPGSYDTYTNRGLAYMLKNDPDRALADFTKALPMKPYFDYQIYYYRADIYRKKGMYREARADLEKIITRTPEQGKDFIMKARTMLQSLPR